MAIKEAKIIKMILPNFSIGIDDNNKEYRFKGGVLGQRVLLRTGKMKAGYLSAKLLEIIEKSPLETLDNGQDPNIMSGNKFENIPYDKELDIKRDMINELYKELGLDQPIKVNPLPLEKAYRNKMEYTFGDSYKGGPLVLGMHKVGKFYEISDYAGGQIANDDFDKIRVFSQDFFRSKDLSHHHKTRHQGQLKFLVIRYSFFQNAFMVNLVTTSSPKIDHKLLDDFRVGLENLKMDGQIVSLYHTISDSVSDAIKPDKITKVWGQDHLTEMTNGLVFNISPFSFFQPNPKGAELLYNKALEFAGNIDNKIVFDLYSGTGTISQIFAKKAKHVVGVEIIEEAVEKARENASINNLDNLDFRANDVLVEIENLTDSPDIVVVDPPRAGIHKDAIVKIASMNSDTIVYISCNPATQVEDIKVFMEKGYKVEKIEAFDQFPKTMNIETVALLSKLDIKEKIEI